MLQTMCALCGMRSQVNIIKRHTYVIRNKEGVASCSYNLTVNPDTNETKLNSNSSSIVGYNGVVWCVNNDNTTLFVKRNGLITIQGNCLGKAGDFTVVGMTADEPGKR